MGDKKSKMTIFLSYATEDHYFAELAEVKLAEDGIAIWRDSSNLRAGDDWKKGIEEGIGNCVAVVVALSENSSTSSYVTFEWAYAMGKGIPVIPIKLNQSQIHPRLEMIQFLDFSIPGALPWNSLVERLEEIEVDENLLSTEEVDSDKKGIDKNVKGILEYLNQRGYTMVSYNRIRKQIDETLSDEVLEKLINENRTVFRRARLFGGVPGIAKVI